MPPKAGSSTAYRDRVEDEDEDDLDDLDDVLASFNQPSKPKPPQDPAPQATIRPNPSNSITNDSKASVQDEGGEDFEASLVEGMESLLRQLAGDNPPGPMPGATSTRAGPNDGYSRERGMGGGMGGLSADEEEKAFQRAIEMMLSKEGIDALGLDDDDLDGEEEEDRARKPALPTSQIKKESTSSGSNPKSRSIPNSGPSSTRPDPVSFEETIRKAMESLNTAGEKKPSSGSAGMDGIPSDPAELAKLLAQLGNDPNLDLEGDDELSGILDGMMGQLMTREVLEEPMSELASKYPEYLASPPPSLPRTDLEKYKKQSQIVQTIVDTFRKPGYTDEKDGKEIARLVGEMQDLGGPPQEIMGDLPEGFDLGALAGDESCTIM